MSDLRKAAEMALEALMQTTLEDVMVEVEPNAWEYKSIVAIQALRQALAEEALDRMAAENQRLGLYDEDNPQVTGEVTTEVPCKTHPDAPHGFDRNASHSADRYVCECEGWEPPQREWVGLTDEEIQAERHKLDPTAGWTYDNFARAIEAKLKEKNVP